MFIKKIPQYNFAIEFWNCSESVVFFVFLLGFGNVQKVWYFFHLIMYHTSFILLQTTETEVILYLFFALYIYFFYFCYLYNILWHIISHQLDCNFFLKTSVMVYSNFAISCLTTNKNFFPVVRIIISLKMWCLLNWRKALHPSMTFFGRFVISISKDESSITTA